MIKGKDSLIRRLGQYRYSNGDTCLHIAAKASNKGLVEYLLKNKINDANTVNNRKETPLMSLLIENEDKKA